MPPKSIYHNETDIVQSQSAKREVSNSQAVLAYTMIHTGIATTAASLVATGTNGCVLGALSLAIHGFSLVVALGAFYLFRLFRLWRSR